VLLVDNGIHTGATALVAMRALRRVGVSRIVVAAPAAAPSALAAVEAAADEVVALVGTEPFGHVGLWYTRLDVPGFGDIGSLLNEAHASSAVRTE
jgi:predicted phosphoribosyltransferase